MEKRVWVPLVELRAKAAVFLDWPLGPSSFWTCRYNLYLEQLLLMARDPCLQSTAAQWTLHMWCRGTPHQRLGVAEDRCGPSRTFPKSKGMHRKQRYDSLSYATLGSFRPFLRLDWCWSRAAPANDWSINPEGRGPDRGRP
jgi:hypothetical protein